MKRDENLASEVSIKRKRAGGEKLGGEMTRDVFIVGRDEDYLCDIVGFMGSSFSYG